jgi:hypothetical protein
MILECDVWDFSFLFLSLISLFSMDRWIILLVFGISKDGKSGILRSIFFWHGLVFKLYEPAICVNWKLALVSLQ